MWRSSASALAIFALVACRGPVQREIPKYAPLPPVAKAPDLEPSPSLVTMTLACRPEESRTPNAIDDDCDGHIDDAPRDAALVVSVAFAARAELDLELRAASGEVIEPLAREPLTGCASDASFRVLTRSYATLPEGAAELVLRHRGVCGEPENVTVSVGLGTATGSHSYAGTLAPAEELVLARITAP